MAIHRKGRGPLSIPGPCFICGKLITSDQDVVFWHGVTGGQLPFIRLHPECAHTLAAGLSDDLRQLESGEDDEEGS
ncbi:MAG: hypothetical protein HY259_09315 [Chloroflexi bacterium]|nr:hypothetical protein [Chloroflexota bacterium]